MTLIDTPAELVGVIAFPVNRWLPEAGSYRVFADFERDGRSTTLGADLNVDGPANYRSLPAPSSSTTTATGYDVEVSGEPARAGDEAELEFTVSRNGEVVHTEPYLGAGGHLVALRQGDPGFLHDARRGSPAGVSEGGDRRRRADGAVKVALGFARSVLRPTTA